MQYHIFEFYVTIICIRFERSFLMFARFLLVFFFFAFSFNSEANLKLNLENQKDFLNALYDDFEKLKYKKSKDDKNEDDEDDEHDKEIDRYKKDIKTLKKTLITIEEATSQKDAKKEVLQELIDDFNKRMKELEKNYKFILAKIKKNKSNEGYLSNKSHEVQTIDYLLHNNKRRRMGDKKYQPLELTEINNSAAGTEYKKMPTEQED